jgi:hypothetical protein
LPVQIRHLRNGQRIETVRFAYQPPIMQGQDAQGLARKPAPLDPCPEGDGKAAAGVVASGLRSGYSRQNSWVLLHFSRDVRSTIREIQDGLLTLLACRYIRSLPYALSHRTWSVGGERNSCPRGVLGCVVSSLSPDSRSNRRRSPISPSSRASAAPRQKCLPMAKER